MPELPEVENFRQILLHLVGQAKGQKKSRAASAIILECPSPVPPKSFPPKDVIDSINRGGYIIADVVRRGKVICIVLGKQKSSGDVDNGRKRSRARNSKKSKTKCSSESTAENKGGNHAINGNEPTIFVSLHMGMTGRISSPHHVPRLESLSDSDSYPPPHTHMIFRSSNGEEASFSDPRRFGSVLVHGCADGILDSDGNNNIHDTIVPTFQELAADALEASREFSSQRDSHSSETEMQPNIVDILMNQRRGIKALLLDQRAIVSGVGNWVADEVLYRSNIHPDQVFLTLAEAQTLVGEMHHVLSTAVQCLNDGDDFPSDWLFHRRWRSGGGGGVAKDVNGKSITFILSGGRSSAIVPLLQKKKSRTKSNVSQIESKAKHSKKEGKVQSVSVAKVPNQKRKCIDEQHQLTKVTRKARKTRTSTS